MTIEAESLSELAFTEKMVAKYRDLLLVNAGLTSVNIDGQTVSMADLETKYDHWQKKLSRANGTRTAVATINLRNT